MKTIKHTITSLFIIISSSFSLQAGLGDYNPELPAGLSYQVMVGPLDGELALSLQGLFTTLQVEENDDRQVTYFAGVYRTAQEASVYESTLRHHGIEQCQVVAYFSKRPIPMVDALAMENDQNAIDAAFVNGSNTVSVDQLNTLLDIQENKIPFYYTVQIGVYNSTTVNPKIEKMNNIIIRQKNDGSYSCSTGRKATLDEAKNLRSQMVAAGFADAFITAYIDGKRVSTDEARIIEKELDKITLVAR